jgi:cytochrome b561
MTPEKHTLANRTAWTYAAPAIALHWLLAILLTTMVALGWYMMSIENEPNSAWYFNLHKSIGITVFALVLLRMLWRVSHKPAPLPAFVPPWQVKLASATQVLLYGCMIILPVTGLTGALYSKHGVSFFGIGLPTLAPNHALSEQLYAIHGVVVWVLVGLVALHVAGGLKHLVVDRDGVFGRMWPNVR